MNTFQKSFSTIMDNDAGKMNLKRYYDFQNPTQHDMDNIYSGVNNLEKHTIGELDSGLHALEI